MGRKVGRDGRVLTHPCDPSGTPLILVTGQLSLPLSVFFFFCPLRVGGQ